MNTIIFGTMLLSFIAKCIEIKLHSTIAEEEPVEEESMEVEDEEIEELLEN